MEAAPKKTHLTLITFFLLLTHVASLNKPAVSAGPSFKRGQWLRAAVLGGNNGALATTTLMIGVGGVNQDSKTMVVTGATDLLAGALGMGGGEFVSVHAQYDIELSQLLRERGLPSPFQAAAASAVSYPLGAALPLLAAVFIPSYSVRVGMAVATVSVSLVGFGWLAAVLGWSPSKMWAVLRMLGGGWLEMGVIFYK